MKRFFSKTLLVLLTLIIAIAHPADAAKKKKKKYRGPVYAAIVMEHSTGKILHEYNADKRTYPASLAKMMTLYLLFEAMEKGKVKMSTRMKVTQNAANKRPMKLGLRRGQKITVKDAMLALITKSANDVAATVAAHLGKTEKNFAVMMTRKARQLGLKRTVFKNSSGWPDRRQVTTARDMLKLSQALYKRFPRYYRYFRTRTFIYKGQRYRNHNHLLKRTRGVDGIKTGFINASGFNLAASAKRNGTRLFVVVMGGKTGRWRDRRVTSLFNMYFSKAHKIYLAHKRTTARSIKAIVKNFVPPHKPGSDLLPYQISPFLAATDNTAQMIVSAKDFEDLPPIHDSVPLATPDSPEDYQDPEDIKKIWAAQFGAFRNKQDAQNRADLLTTLIPNLPGALTVAPATKRRNPLYRARLVKLTKTEAETVCKKMRYHEIPCLPIRDEKR